jgi:hypothetical protein
VSVNKISHIQIPIAILDSRSNYHILTEKFIEYYNLKLIENNTFNKIGTAKLGERISPIGYADMGGFIKKAYIVKNIANPSLSAIVLQKQGLTTVVSVKDPTKCIIETNSNVYIQKPIHQLGQFPILSITDLIIKYKSEESSVQLSNMIKIEECLPETYLQA